MLPLTSNKYERLKQKQRKIEAIGQRKSHGHMRSLKVIWSHGYMRSHDHVQSHGHMRSHVIWSHDHMPHMVI